MPARGACRYTIRHDQGAHKFYVRARAAIEFLEAIGREDLIPTTKQVRDQQQPADGVVDEAAGEVVDEAAGGAAEARLAAAAAENEELRSTVAEQGAKIAEQGATIAEQAAEIVTINAKVAEQDGKIAEQAAEIAEQGVAFNAKIAELAAEQERAIDELRSLIETGAGASQASNMEDFGGFASDTEEAGGYQGFEV